MASRLTKRSIKLALPKGRSASVRAIVRGIWAAHRRDDDGDDLGTGWTITHVPSGYGVGDLASNLALVDALNILMLLGERCSGQSFRDLATGKLDREIGGVIEATVAEGLHG